jgi:hypothetical protein
MEMKKIQLTLENGTLLTMETNNLEDFEDKFRYGESSTVMQALDGTTFRVSAIMSYKIVSAK